MILDRSLTEPLVAWVLNKSVRDFFVNIVPEHHTEGKPLGFRYMHKPSAGVLHSGYPYQEVSTIADSMLEYYDLHLDTPIEPNYGYLISYSEEGHEVHPHRDANWYGDGPDVNQREYKPKNWIGDVVHCRLNVLISKPVSGGNPIIKGVEIPVAENEAWICMSGAHTHSTTRVQGSKPRILLSLGYFIPTKLAVERGWIDKVSKNNS
jgi:hypothetical protein